MLDPSPDTPPAETARRFASDGHLGALFARLPQGIRDSFTEQQAEALKKAAADLRWGLHPINIRITIPTFFGRFYMVLIAGRERRNYRRRKLERLQHPLFTPANMVFIAGLLGVVFTISYIFAMQFLQDYVTTLPH